MNRPPPDVALDLAIRPQPDDTTCGPTCLHAIYRWFGDPLPLSQVIAETATLDSGGTLDVFLANHALRRGYRACIYTYNLSVFDPTWFTTPGVDVAERLRLQAAEKPASRLQAATRGYLEFLELGGGLKFEDLTASLLRRLLRRRLPVLTGLSATYLYRDAREHGPEDLPDDIRGEPAGHFVLLTGYQRASRQVFVADPMEQNPVAPGQRYAVGIDRLICSILLGIVTYDANLLVIEPARSARGSGSPG